jgi:hypothetical protein
MTSCSFLGTSPVTDACSLLDRNAVSDVMGSKITRMELDPGGDNGKVAGSACMMEFQGGEFVRLSIEQYSDTEYMIGMRGAINRNRPPKDEAMSETLGFAAYYDDSRESLMADLSENTFLFINMDQRRGATSSVDVYEGVMTVDFDYLEVTDARRKAQGLAKSIKL